MLIKNYYVLNQTKVISNQNYGQIFYDDQKGYPLDIFHDFEKNIGVSYV